MASPVEVSRMSKGQHADFLEQLRWSALEEAPLWEVPLGCTDLVQGGPVEHGPWLPGDCSDVLVRWLDEGLIGLFVASPGDSPEDLETSAARSLLSSPAEWNEDRRTFLCVPDHGRQVDPGNWK